MKYYIISGEASGDLHGSNLVKQLYLLDAEADIRCWGGDLMQAAGATLVKHYRDLAFMGFAEVVKNLPTILQNIRFCKQDILSFQPDTLVLIDYPGFNLRIAEWAKQQGFKVIYYISPQVWAWKANRVKKMKQCIDKMLCILPFEKKYYRDTWNWEVEYVGHPLVEVVEKKKQFGVWSLVFGVTEQNPEPQTPNPKLQTPISIAIFASGAGSNAQKIIEHLKGHVSMQVALIVCNKPDAGVLSIAQTHGIPTLLIEKERFFRGDAYLAELQNYQIRFIVLAGFLWKVPDALIKAYPDRIINIHPALLPKYGGKGMYGMRVHEAVIAAGEKESGITIHYVNEHFDEGAPIFQARCPVEPGDTPEQLAQKIHALEHRYFPETVEKTVEKLNR